MRQRGIGFYFYRDESLHPCAVMNDSVCVTEIQVPLVENRRENKLIIKTLIIVIINSTCGVNIRAHVRWSDAAKKRNKPTSLSFLQTCKWHLHRMLGMLNFLMLCISMTMQEVLGPVARK